jgi:hypothetical protein
MSDTTSNTPEAPEGAEGAAAPETKPETAETPEAPAAETPAEPAPKVRMKAPENVETFSVGGVLREIENGFIHIEQEFVAEAQAHGFLLHDDENKAVAAAAENKTPETHEAAVTTDPAAGASTGTQHGDAAESGASSAPETPAA